MRYLLLKLDKLIEGVVQGGGAVAGVIGILWLTGDLEAVRAVLAAYVKLD